MTAQPSELIPICSWCDVRMDGGDGADGDGPLDRPVTHGICARCATALLAERGVPLGIYLDGLDVPVVLLDGDGRVRHANAHTRTLLGKDLPDIRGALSGDVFECRHARLPEGCGQTVHCSGCTIRRSVTDTWTTGSPRLRVPAALNRGTDDAPATTQLLISTERAGDVVLLRIDELNGVRLGRPPRFGVFRHPSA